MGRITSAQASSGDRLVLWSSPMNRFLRWMTVVSGVIALGLLVAGGIWSTFVAMLGAVMAALTVMLVWMRSLGGSDLHISTEHGQLVVPTSDTSDATVSWPVANVAWAHVVFERASARGRDFDKPFLEIQLVDGRAQRFGYVLGAKVLQDAADAINAALSLTKPVLVPAPADVDRVPASKAAEPVQVEG